MALRLSESVSVISLSPKTTWPQESMQAKNSSQIHYSFTIAFGLKGQSYGAKFRGHCAPSPPSLSACPSTRPIVGTLSSQQGGRQDLLFRVGTGPNKWGCVTNEIGNEIRFWKYFNENSFSANSKIPFCIHRNSRAVVGFQGPLI